VQLETVAHSTDGVIPPLLTVHLLPAGLPSAVLVLLAVLSSPRLPPPLPPPLLPLVHGHPLSHTLTSVVLDPVESLAQVLEPVASSTGVALSMATVDPRTTFRPRATTADPDASQDMEPVTPGQFPQFQLPAQLFLPMTHVDLS